MSEKPPIIESDFMEAEDFSRSLAELQFCRGFSTTALTASSLKEVVAYVADVVKTDSATSICWKCRGERKHSQ